MPWLTGVFGLAPGSAADPSDNLEVIIQWHHLELYLRSQSVAGGSLLALLRYKPAALGVTEGHASETAQIRTLSDGPLCLNRVSAGRRTGLQGASACAHDVHGERR